MSSVNFIFLIAYFLLTLLVGVKGGNLTRPVIFIIAFFVLLLIGEQPVMPGVIVAIAFFTSMAAPDIGVDFKGVSLFIVWFLVLLILLFAVYAIFLALSSIRLVDFSGVGMIASLNAFSRPLKEKKTNKDAQKASHLGTKNVERNEANPSPKGVKLALGEQDNLGTKSLQGAVSNELKQAITLIKSGDKQNGRLLLVKILKAQPRKETAWLWMSSVVVNDEQRYYCLKQVLKINPNIELSG